MSVVLTIVYCVIVLGFLVFIHEGGHYLAARAFGVRVSEFMLGLPAPHIGFKWHGTKFGVTVLPLGGYARICGMEPGEASPYLKDALAFVYEYGTVQMEDFAVACGIDDEEALAALDELVEWGAIVAPHKDDPYNTYRTPEVREGFHCVEPEGVPRPVEDAEAFFQSEAKQQYRSLPFWKRCCILLAGPGMNLLFAILAIVVIYSVIGVDIADETGAVQHMTFSFGRSLYAGCYYIVMVVGAIISLFNPATAAETVSNSTSIVGIAVMSKSAADQGLLSFIMFAAMISVSLGLMNLLPIPPLDGGRFLIEIIQKIVGRDVSVRVLNFVSILGITLFFLFFVFMLNQDVQRFILGS